MLEKKDAGTPIGEEEDPVQANARKILKKIDEAEKDGGDALKSLVRKYLAYAVCMNAIVAPKLEESARRTAELAEALLKYL